MAGGSDLSGIDLRRDLSSRRITADYVADAIREAINGGQLPDGAVLNQADIAAHFGVSRVPVREAMRELQAEGLIEGRAHRLAVVRGMSIERLVEVFSLRALIEGWLAELATAHITESLLDEARAINEQLRTESDHTRWLELNAELHELLYRPSGALATLELLAQLRSRAERYTRMWSRGTGVHRPVETCAEHDRIIELMAAGDAAGARAAVERHVRHTRDRVVEAGTARSHREAESVG
jgi:DNA-binding GntR family transcriptional regulator